MNFSRFNDPQYWMGLLYAIPAVLIAFSVHEYFHAYAAYKCGDPTAKNLGRMTMDPTKHLDLLGTICLLLFGFGWAKPVPINPRNFKKYKKHNLIVALAGIIANLVLSFIVYGIFFFSVNGGVTNEIYINILRPIISLNIALAIFNVLPIPPLDGFSLISTFIPAKYANITNGLYRYGFIILLILIFTGFTSIVLGGLSGIIQFGYYQFYSLFLF